MVAMRSLISSGVLTRARLEHQLLAVHDHEPSPLQREQDRRLDDVDAERLAGEATRFELDV